MDSSSSSTKPDGLYLSLFSSLSLWIYVFEWKSKYPLIYS